MKNGSDQIYKVIANATKDLDLSVLTLDKQRENRFPMTLWFPMEYQKKYEKIQSVTRKGFCRHLRKTIMAIMDSIDVEGKG